MGAKILMSEKGLESRMVLTAFFECPERAQYKLQGKGTLIRIHWVYD
jgi:hypothetical protein